MHDDCSLSLHCGVCSIIVRRLVHTRLVSSSLSENHLHCTATLHHLPSPLFVRHRSFRSASRPSLAVAAVVSLLRSTPRSSVSPTGSIAIRTGHTPASLSHRARSLRVCSTLVYSVYCSQTRSFKIQKKSHQFERRAAPAGMPM